MLLYVSTAVAATPTYTILPLLFLAWKFSSFSEQMFRHDEPHSMSHLSAVAVTTLFSSLLYVSDPLHLHPWKSSSFSEQTLQQPQQQDVSARRATIDESFGSVSGSGRGSGGGSGGIGGLLPS